ncbi:hypothetical protein EON65_59010 [archaeon]|nr:MAG: hypothetical protein EON65_59010 [archaeon]
MLNILIDFRSGLDSGPLDLRTITELNREQRCKMMSSGHGTALEDEQGGSSHGMVAMNAELKGRDVKLDEWAKEDLTIRKKYELKLLKKFDK